jgi:hypothetical protein
MLQNSVAFLNMLHMQRKILHSRYFFAPLPDILAPQFHNFDRQKKNDEDRFKYSEKIDTYDFFL